MACNFIIDNKGGVRMTSFLQSQIYDIGEINFYVPTSMALNKQIFLVLKNTDSLYEIIELKIIKDKSSSTNLLYKITLNGTIRINNEQADIYLMFIDKESGEVEFSASKKINISTEKYSLARSVYIAQQLNTNIAEYYAKIVALTAKNKELYEKIQKGDK